MNRLVLVLVAAAATLASGAGSSTAAATCPASNPPDSLTLAGGTPQTAKLGRPFAVDLQVVLANTNGCPVTTGAAGVAVTFSAPASDASGTFEASGSPSVTVGTNAAGTAAAPQLTANRTAGSYTVVATSDYGSVSFSLTNTAAGVAATLGATGSTTLSATVGTQYAQPLEVKLLDANANPVAGATVTFSLGAAGNGGEAGATFDGGQTQATAVTDDAGVATSPLFAANGVAGTFTASAATAGVVQPVTFRLDNLAGKPPTLAAVGRTARSATVGTRYRGPLEVKVLDASGSPVRGTSVTFSLGGSDGANTAGASFVGGSAQATATTEADGIATSPLFTANGTAGRFSATASMAGVRNPVSFNLRNRAASAPSIAVVGSPSRSASTGGRYAEPLRVRVLDGTGRPLEGASVTFSLGTADAGSSGSSSAGATFIGGSSEATQTTNAAGVATSPRFAANDVAGKITATATTTGTTHAAAFTLRNTATGAATITPGVAASESTVVGTGFAVRLAVTVKDERGNPVQGARVTFAAPAHGPTARFGRKHSRTAVAITNADGIALAPHLTAGTKAGGFVVTANARGVAHGAAFALVNQPRL